MSSVVATLVAYTTIKSSIAVSLPPSSTWALLVIPSEWRVRGSGGVLAGVSVFLGEEGWVGPELVLLEAQEGLGRLGEGAGRQPEVGVDGWGGWECTDVEAEMCYSRGESKRREKETLISLLQSQLACMLVIEALKENQPISISSLCLDTSQRLLFNVQCPIIRC